MVEPKYVKPQYVKSHYVKKHCSPKKDKLDYTCLSRKAIVKIAKSLNKLPNISVTYKKRPVKNIYSQICKIMETHFNCKNEACWLNIRNLMNSLSDSDRDYFQRHFRPHMPKDIVDDYTKWISNYDIEAVLNQYDRESDDIYSYGAVPIDFKKCEVSGDLCKIDINKHKKYGQTKLAMVFNTDDSSGPGRHWMAMYVDILGKNLNNQPGIYFFDSFASSPMKEIKELIETIKQQGSKNNIDFIVAINDISFQRNNFSCGFYCMHFLENMLQEIPFHRYLKSGINDEKMIKYRNQCYLHPNEIKY